MEETQISESCCAQNTERKEKAYLFNEPALWGRASLVKRIPEEKTFPRGKRQLLILVLSEDVYPSTNVLWKLNNEEKREKNKLHRIPSK